MKDYADTRNTDLEIETPRPPSSHTPALFKDFTHDSSHEYDDQYLKRVRSKTLNTDQVVLI